MYSHYSTLYWRLFLTWAILAFFACASQKQREINYRYKRTQYLIAASLPIELIDKCGVIFNKTLPVIEEFKDTHGDNSKEGYFLKESNTILLKKGSGKILIHEFTHFFNQNGLHGPLSRDCLDEMTAYYLAEIDRLREENRRLRIQRF